MRIWESFVRQTEKVDSWVNSVGVWLYVYLMKGTRREDVVLLGCGEWADGRGTTGDCLEPPPGPYLQLRWTCLLSVATGPRLAAGMCCRGWSLPGTTPPCSWAGDSFASLLLSPVLMVTIEYINIPTIYWFLVMLTIYSEFSGLGSLRIAPESINLRLLNFLRSLILLLA